LLWNEINEAKGTNLYSSIYEMDDTIKEYNDFLVYARQWNTTQDNNDSNWLNEKDYNYDSLLWARSHYVSRRYPDFVNSHIHLGHNGREKGLGNLGNLVPALDLLNHSHNENWLRLELSGNKLLVIINVDRPKGSELFSNYGSLSNEELLYAYGFSIQNNINDKFTVKLKTGDDNNIFYITKENGIPADLWRKLSLMVFDEEIPESSMINIDTCEILLDFLQQKLLTINSNNNDNNETSKHGDISVRSKFISYYYQSQLEILTASIETLIYTMEEIDAEGIEEDEVYDSKEEDVEEVYDSKEEN
jgi:hypothetical protein